MRQKAAAAEGGWSAQAECTNITDAHKRMKFAEADSESNLGAPAATEMEWVYPRLHHPLLTLCPPVVGQLAAPAYLLAHMKQQLDHFSSICPTRRQVDKSKI